jgi:putative transposase
MAPPVKSARPSELRNWIDFPLVAENLKRGPSFGGLFLVLPWRFAKRPDDIPNPGFQIIPIIVCRTTITTMHKQTRKNSLRLQGFDYGTAGAYFVTICCLGRQPFLGEVIEGKVSLSPIGEILADEWEKTREIRASVRLDTSVIMPNHFHALVWISQKRRREIPQYHFLLQTPSHANRFMAPSANLSSMVRGLKGAVTRRARAAGFPEFAWQRSFHDRIVREKEELLRIRAYIQNNPANWQKDEFHP